MSETAERHARGWYAIEEGIHDRELARLACTAVVQYAPWSINVYLYDAADQHLATFHDCGHDVTARLSLAQANDLSRQLAGRLTVVPFEPR